MESRKGFTLIELMVVILIVGILAAVAIPLMKGRIDSAKWSEANAAAGTIRTGIRAYWAEKGDTYASYAADLNGGVAVFGTPIGIDPTDLDGRYFLNACYVISGAAINAGGTGLDYLITVPPATAPGPGGAPSSPLTHTLDQTGAWN